MWIKRNDTVAVITGDDRGTQGRVLRVMPKAGKLVVEGVNRVYKHVRQQPARTRRAGGSRWRCRSRCRNVALVCQSCKRATRVGARFLPDGGKERYCKKCGAANGVIAPAEGAVCQEQGIGDAMSEEPNNLPQPEEQAAQPQPAESRQRSRPAETAGRGKADRGKAAQGREEAEGGKGRQRGRRAKRAPAAKSSPRARRPPKGEKPAKGEKDGKGEKPAKGEKAAKGEKGGKGEKAPPKPIPTPRLQERYQKEILPGLAEHLGRSNRLSLPRLQKIVVNMGVGKATAEKKYLEEAVEALKTIAGQKPVITLSRQSIAGFKLREGMAIGCKVTLRGKRMWEFLDRLISMALAAGARLPRPEPGRLRRPRQLHPRPDRAIGVSRVEPGQVHPDPGHERDVGHQRRSSNDEARELLRRLGMPLRAA